MGHEAGATVGQWDGGTVGPCGGGVVGGATETGDTRQEAGFRGQRGVVGSRSPVPGDQSQFSDHGVPTTDHRSLLRPFHSGGQKEITRIPPLYGFDTGFVSRTRGWSPLRPDDCSLLWEHLVLEHLRAHLPDLPLHYWRDKAGRKVDFVLVRNRDQVDAIECKWDPSEFDPAGLKAFRALHAKGDNYLVCPLTLPAYLKQAGDLEIHVCDPAGTAI